MKPIKRTFYVDRPEDIDYNNIGCHFTADLNYNHLGGGSNGGTVERMFKVTIYAEEYIVNDEATKVSNENYPHEKEVVLEMDQTIEVEINIAKHNGLGYGYCKPERITVNTGDRADLWVKNM